MLEDSETAVEMDGAMPAGLDGSSGTNELKPPDEPVLEQLRQELEQLGLTGYEARVLLALLQLGTATPAQVAELSQVPRTRVYSVLDTLGPQGLAQQIPGRAAVWSSVGRTETMVRLKEVHRLQWQEAQAKVERASAILENLGPEGRPSGVPYVHVLRTVPEVKAAYKRLLDQASSDLLVCNKPPYSSSPEQPNPAVLDALARGVRARALYEVSELVGAETKTFLASHAAYHEAGVQARILPELPMKLAVADGRMTLLAMVDPVAPELGFPTNLCIEHPGFAAMQVAAFEQLWATAQPYEPPAIDLRYHMEAKT